MKNWVPPSHSWGFSRQDFLLFILLVFKLHAQTADGQTSAHQSPQSEPARQPHFLEDETRGKPMLAGAMATNVPHRMTGAGMLFAQPAPEGKLSRWFALESAVLTSRYRYVDDSRGVTTANGVQYREALKGRFRFDPEGNYEIVAGVFSGNAIT